MAIWELDTETGAMWWSAQARRLFGFPDEADAARTRLPHVVRRIHPDDRAAFQAAVADAVSRAGEVHRIQARVPGPDDSVRWIEARGQSSLDAEGRLRGLRGTLVDVTELKRVEQDLRRNLDELRVVAAVAECASEAGDEKTLLERVTQILREALAYEACGFLLLDEDHGLLSHTPCFHSWAKREELRPFELGSGVVGEVAASGEVRRIDDTLSDPRDVGPAQPGVRAQLCVPLRVGPRVLGVLDAESTRVGAFTTRDERLLVVVASHVANALERLRGEEALRRSGEMYRAYFTASPLAVFVSDKHGKYLEVNGAATAVTGYSRDELLEMEIPDLLVTEGADGLRDRLAGLLAMGVGHSEIKIRRKDGSVRHCLVHAAAIGSDRLLGFLLDITDRREAEEKLRESEERHRGLSEASLEAVMVHDGGRIVDVNHALCELVGYSWHELIGRDGFQLIAPEDREAVYRMLLTEYERPREVTGLRRDGSRVPLEVRARSFPYRGQILSVVALRDISERARAEKVRESLIGDLEAKNAELERFTHTVSHDLKAPLITIRGFAQYLLRDLEEGRPERVGSDASRIFEAAGQMQHLLDHLVALSRAGLGAAPPEPVHLDVVALEALGLVEGRRADTGVRVELASGLPVVFGDHARLVQVFQNLLENAVKFTAGVKEPLVTVRPGPLDKGEGEATIIVADNGKGIDPAHHNRVFGLFEKLDPACEGTGVGLAVVRRIVETHGGRARVESQGAGQGTEVWVTLPTPPEGQEAQPKNASLREAAGRPAG
jgi:PAS domain S-box-containing protein